MPTDAPDPENGIDYHAHYLNEPRPERSRRRLMATRIAILTGVALFASFWVWALFFASKEGVNRINDRDWAARAEGICLSAIDERSALADFRVLADGGSELIRERASIVVTTTDLLESMLDNLVSVPPADEKGRAIVPLWESEYRIYIQDRRNYAAQLNETGENLPFYETQLQVPVSERLDQFAIDNEMPSCSPPRDLSR